MKFVRYWNDWILLGIWWNFEYFKNMNVEIMMILLKNVWKCYFISIWNWTKNRLICPAMPFISSYRHWKCVLFQACSLEILHFVRFHSLSIFFHSTKLLKAFAKNDANCWTFRNYRRDSSIIRWKHKILCPVILIENLVSCNMNELSLISMLIHEWPIAFKLGIVSSGPSL